MNHSVNKECLSEFNTTDLRCYSGWIQSTSSYVSKYYTIEDETELKALEVLHENKCTIHENKLYINKHLPSVSTGIHNALVIWQHVNVALYEYNQEILKNNPSAKLVRIKTDSLGYTCPTPIKAKISDKYGEFKAENKAGKKFIEIENDEATPDEPHHMTRPEHETYQINDYKKLINKSFSILCPAGYGKSYFINNQLAPELEQQGYKVIKLGTTLTSSENGTSTFQKFSRSYFEDLDIDDKTYIIVDEISQMNLSGFKMLEHYKNHFSCNLILMGDINQCKLETIDYQGIISYLCDNKSLVIPYRENISRYSKELNDKLQKILDYKGYDLANYTLKIFNKNIVKTHDKDAINLCYTHKYGETKLEKKYHTVHSYQGNTIETTYYIHEIHKSPQDVIYTALSRARDISQIKILN
jgi:hypothetical protein